MKLIPNCGILSTPFTVRLEKIHNCAMFTVEGEAGGMHELNAAVPFRVGSSVQEKVHCVEATMHCRRFESCTKTATPSASAGVNVGTTSDKASHQANEPLFGCILYTINPVAYMYQVNVGTANEQGLDDIDAFATNCGAERCSIRFRKQCGNTLRVNIVTALE
ncbi:hypothetical protein QBC43DRAFT_208060 [Cladorrhinum sp. PSN259]|nr:hypothetical protein QBC43DRAFT_208060 [Cladorrhinum sp. PSN259]